MQPVTIGIVACLFGVVLIIAGLMLMRRAVANQRSLDDTMHRRAMHDPLTGLPNRAMFMDSLERALHARTAHSSRLSVLFVDLDHFKEVNDTMGHDAGDLLLRKSRERLRSCVRQSDLVARLAGDEFVVLIEEHGGPEEVMIVAQKILEALRAPVTDRLARGEHLGQHRHRELPGGRRGRRARWSRTPTPRCTRPRSAGATTSSSTRAS